MLREGIPQPADGKETQDQRGPSPSPSLRDYLPWHCSGVPSPSGPCSAELQAPLWSAHAVTSPQPAEPRCPGQPRAPRPRTWDLEPQTGVKATRNACISVCAYFTFLSFLSSFSAPLVTFSLNQKGNAKRGSPENDLEATQPPPQGGRSVH